MGDVITKDDITTYGDVIIDDDVIKVDYDITNDDINVCHGIMFTCTDISVTRLCFNFRPEQTAVVTVSIGRGTGAGSSSNTDATSTSLVAFCPV